MRFWIFTGLIFFSWASQLYAHSCASFFENNSQEYDKQFAEHFRIQKKSNMIFIQASDETYRVFYKDSEDLVDECRKKASAFADAIVPTSTSMLHFFHLLEKEESVKAFPGTRYITSPTLKKRVEQGLIQELGDSSSLEALLLMDPDLILTQGSAFVSAAGLERYQKIVDRNFSFLEFKENHPLARAEWIVVLAAILGEMEKGVALFEQIKNSYQKTQGLFETSDEPMPVLVGAFFQGRWFSPAPESDFLKILEDAGAELVTPTSQVGLNFENVLLHSKRAEFWLPQASWQTREESVAMDERHLILLEQFEDTKILALKKKSQGLEFWEKGVARPDLVLKDLAQLFGHLPKDQLRFYTSLESREALK